MVAVIAGLFVVMTFGWIIVDSIRSSRRDKVFMAHRAACVADVDGRIRALNSQDVEGRVLVSMTKIASAYPPHPRSLENTPPEMSAISADASNETSFTKAIREKTEEISKSAIKKVKA